MKYALKILLNIFFLITSSSLVGFAQSGFISSESTSGNLDYDNPLPALKELVKVKSKSKNNTFYVSKMLHFENGLDQVWVYWRENQSLILWEPHLSGTNEREELLLSRRYLSFGIEIVPATRYYEGSNFLTLMEDGIAVKNECLREGRKFIITKPRRRNLKRK